jgi:hypothetical protein
MSNEHAAAFTAKLGHFAALLRDFYATKRASFSEHSLSIRDFFPR